MDPITDLLAAVRPVEGSAASRARALHDDLAKPPGSLGRLEAVAARLAAISGQCPPPVPTRPVLVTAVADHGVHARGVTPWPQELSTTIARTVAAGGACSSVLADQVGARLVVLDVGLATEPDDTDGMHRVRVRPGTRDLTVEPAMSGEEAAAAVRAGAATAAEAIADGADLLVTGEIGIGNTTTSACLIAALTGEDPAQVVGGGSGIDDAMLVRKREVVRVALARHASVDTNDVLTTLASVGGLEHAALVGVILEAAASRIPILLDGVTTNAAALVAAGCQPRVAGYLLAGHRSAEPGAQIALEALGLDGLLDLGMRLGEGSGALLAVPLVQAATRLLHDAATFADLTAR